MDQSDCPFMSLQLIVAVFTSEMLTHFVNVCPEWFIDDNIRTNTSSWPKLKSLSLSFFNSFFSNSSKSLLMVLHWNSVLNLFLAPGHRMSTSWLSFSILVVNFFMTRQCFDRKKQQYQLEVFSLQLQHLCLDTVYFGVWPVEKGIGRIFRVSVQKIGLILKKAINHNLKEELYIV